MTYLVERHGHTIPLSPGDILEAEDGYTAARLVDHPAGPVFQGLYRRLGNLTGGYLVPSAGPWLTAGGPVATIDAAFDAADRAWDEE